MEDHAMKIAFCGAQELFSKLAKVLPGLLSWRTDTVWDGVIVEDWSALSEEKRVEIDRAIGRGQHLLAGVSSEFAFPSLDITMHWLNPPSQVFDADGKTVNVEVLGAFDFVTMDEMRLVPGPILHRSNDRGIVTFEFWKSSSAGKVIISSLQLFRPSLYSDERQRKVILRGLLSRLSSLKEPDSERAEKAEQEASVDTDKWKRIILLDVLMQKEDLIQESRTGELPQKEVIIEYRSRPEDATFLAEEANI